MNKFKPQRNSQLLLLPPSIEDFIPQDHLARVVSEVVESLNVTSVEEKYSEMGQKSYSPRLLLKLLFYGYCIGIRSGRKIAAGCESDTAFMYLASMYRPDFRTINDFRKDNIAFIERAFKQVIQLCQTLGMAQIGNLIIDGTKIRANANAARNKSKAEYENWLLSIDKDIRKILEEAALADAAEDKLYGEKRGDEIPEALRGKQQLKKKIEEALQQIKKEEEKINTTDPDARFILSKQQINLNYNCQAGITEDGVIVSAFTTNNASDKKQLIPVIEQAEQNTSNTFENILADSGYASYDNYEQLAVMNKTTFVPDQLKETESKKQASNPFHKNNFVYNTINDHFICPQGKTLPFAHNYAHKLYKQKTKIYIGTQCGGCSVIGQCTKGKARQIHVEKREELKQQIRHRLDSNEGKLTYIKRMRIEPIFGNIKHNLKYLQFQMRGLVKTNAEWLLICLAHNIKKIHLKGAV